MTSPCLHCHVQNQLHVLVWFSFASVLHLQCLLHLPSAEANVGLLGQSAAWSFTSTSLHIACVLSAAADLTLWWSFQGA